MKSDSYEKMVSYIVENQDQFYRLAYSYVGNKDVALDIVQNAIYIGLTKYSTIRNEEYIKTWFYKVLVNESLAFLKKNKREVSYDNEIIKEPEYHEKAYEPKEDVIQFVNRLPDKVKTIIILYYYEQFTLTEISKITGVNLNTIKSRLYTGLKQLKMMIGGKNDERVK